MLDTYKKKYHKNNFQYILIDHSGNILDSDDTLFSIKLPSNIKQTHPFFNIIDNLVNIKNECFEFSCIHLDFDKNALISDITLHTGKDDEHLIIIEDLTKHYNNYQLTAQTRNESIIGAQVLELKNNYLLEKEAFKNNFIANFSHQLRNPITASIIFSELLIDDDLNSEQTNYINIIKSANRDLKTRIEDILDISKIESGKLVLVDKVFNLKDLLNELIESYKHLIIKKNLEFNYILDPKLPEYLNGDSYRLKQIIGNLLNNAVKFTNKGAITLNLSLNYERANKANIQIVVNDTGIGINPRNHEVIFERFNKLPSVIDNNNGIGLGLSIVKHLVLKMNGNIAVESDSNSGSKFTCNISFKLTRYNKSLKKKLTEDLKNKSGEKQNILLVENAELIQLSVLKILANEGRFYLNIITNGNDVVPHVINQDVDLILLSNTIEGFSAMDLTSSIRNLSKEYRKTPIIIISSEVFKEDLKRFKQAGANATLPKPFDKESLLKNIYKYIK